MLSSGTTWVTVPQLQEEQRMGESLATIEPHILTICAYTEFAPFACLPLLDAYNAYSLFIYIGVSF